jgi:hypothetical protein
MTTGHESEFVGPVQWVQADRHPTSKQRDPIQGEFFNTDSITTLAAKLTREGIGQNPMDAATSQPVRVRVYVSGDAGAVSPTEASVYFEGLRKHVEVCDPEAGQQLDGPCRFLVVEDFNTTGLTGDASATEEPPPSIPNDFFYFFRAEGKSGKSGADRGRWGVGKYVFPMASHINTFFGLTVRDTSVPAANGAQTPGPLLMGQAVLKNHHVDGKSYEPDGWWSDFDDGVPMPLTDEAVVEDFRRTWNVERRSEAGLRGRASRCRSGARLGVWSRSSAGCVGRAERHELRVDETARLGFPRRNGHREIRQHGSRYRLAPSRVERDSPAPSDAETGCASGCIGRSRPWPRAGLGTRRWGAPARS